VEESKSDHVSIVAAVEIAGDLNDKADDLGPRMVQARLKRTSESVQGVNDQILPLGSRLDKSISD